MSQPLRRRVPSVRTAENRHAVRAEQRKPNIRGFKVYVGTFVAPDDPGNDPEGTSPASTPWLNNFIYMPGSPVWYAHGLDGELDMGGMYDLTQGAVSGDIAFMMRLEWAITAPPASMFPVELDAGVWTIAVQTVNHTTGAVRIFWPIVASPVP